jgi:DNA-binding GntR family transcriptional regulator
LSGNLRKLELVRDGVLESHHGKGFFVAEKRQVYSRAERLALAAPAPAV